MHNALNKYGQRTTDVSTPLLKVDMTAARGCGKVSEASDLTPHRCFVK
jgi:hypothetical protein